MYISLFKKVAPFLLDIITMPIILVQIICLCYNSPMYSRLIPGGAFAGRGGALNVLPLGIRRAPSYDAFKRQVKQYPGPWRLRCPWLWLLLRGAGLLSLFEIKKITVIVFKVGVIRILLLSFFSFSFYSEIYKKINLLCMLLLEGVSALPK